MISIPMSMAELQKLVAKYHLTKGGSKREVAERLVRMRSHVMLLSELTQVEDFLGLPPYKRHKGARWYKRKDGSLYPAPDRKLD